MIGQILGRFSPPTHTYWRVPLLIKASQILQGESAGTECFFPQCVYEVLQTGADTQAFEYHRQANDRKSNLKVNRLTQTN